MQAGAVGTGASHRRSTSQCNPLIRSNALRRVVATGIVGAAVTASTVLGAGSASAAGAAVVDSCTGKAESSEFGQSILASPSALDAKVEESMLLVFPLQFDLAEQARQEFLNSGSVSLGTVTEDQQSFSGRELADAFTGQVSSLSSAGDRTDAVGSNFRNLATLGCLGAQVPGQERPAPPPPEPAPEEPVPQPPPEQEASAPPPESPEASEGALAAGATSGSYSAYGAAAPVRVLPPDYTSVPGSLPPWAQARPGQVPGLSPDVGDLLRQSETKKNEDARNAEVRAVGKAEALPTDVSNRVALPVLIAAISLAALTSALVRTWVLRRH